MHTDTNDDRIREVLDTVELAQKRAEPGHLVRKPEILSAIESAHDVSRTTANKWVQLAIADGKLIELHLNWNWKLLVPMNMQPAGLGDVYVQRQRGTQVDGRWTLDTTNAVTLDKVSGYGPGKLRLLATPEYLKSLLAALAAERREQMEKRRAESDARHAERMAEWKAEAQAIDPVLVDLVDAVQEEFDQLTGTRIMGRDAKDNGEIHMTLEFDWNTDRAKLRTFLAAGLAALSSEGTDRLT